MENISGTVNKAIDLLEAFLGDEAELGLTELSRFTGYDNATVHRLLATMVKRGLVFQSHKKGKYCLGLKTLEFSPVVRMHLNYLDITYLHLSRFCRDNGVAVNLTVLDNETALVVDEICTVSDFRPTEPVGKRLPLYATANGKVSLAYLSDEELDGYFQRNTLKSITQLTITSIARLKKELLTIRKEGVAFDNEEYLMGTRAVGAPIFNSKGKILCVAVVVLPAAAFDDNRTRDIAESLKRNTKEISIVTSRIL